MYFLVIDDPEYNQNGTLIYDLSSSSIRAGVEQIINVVSGNPIIHKLDASEGLVVSPQQVYIPVEYTTSPLAGTWVPLRIYNMVLYRKQDFSNYFRNFLSY